MTTPYRPSNGTEGECFESAICHPCRRYRQGACTILANAYVFEIDEPGYPSEWVYDERGRPTCTARNTEPPGPRRRIKPDRSQTTFTLNETETQ